MTNWAAEIMIRAERRLGEMLQQQEMNKGSRLEKGCNDTTGAFLFMGLSKLITDAQKTVLTGKNVLLTDPQTFVATGQNRHLSDL